MLLQKKNTPPYYWILMFFSFFVVGAGVSLWPIQSVFLLSLFWLLFLIITQTIKTKWIIALVIISSLIPEVSLPDFYQGLKLSPDIVTIFFALVIWASDKFLKQKKNSPNTLKKLGTVTIPVVVYTLVVIISAFQSNHLLLSLLKGGRIVLWFLVWIYILVDFINSEERLVWVVNTIIKGIIIVAFLSFIEYIITNPGAIIGSENTRLTGSLMGLSISVYLSFAVVVLITILFFVPVRIQTIIFRSLIIISVFFILYLSQTRIAFVSVAVGVAVSVGLSRGRKKLLFLLLGLPILALVFTAFVLPETSRYHVLLTPSVFFQQGSNIEDYTTWQRVVLWSKALEIMRQHPHLGVGPGLGPASLGITFNRGYNLDVHNAYLSVGLETGWLGLLSFLFMLGGAWIGLLKATSLPHSSVISVYSLAIIGAFTNSLIGLVTGGFSAGGVGVFFSTQIALAISCFRLAHMKTEH